MATTQFDPDKILKLSLQAQKNVLKFSTGILEKKNQFSEIVDKMDAIDIAYARYKESTRTADGVDAVAGDTGCNVFEADDVTPPIVVSQVDAYVAYLSEVFLSGTPLFPVVSAPSKRKHAEELEAIIDDHASIGGYARQLLLFLRDGVKYNFSALEAEWDAIDQFSVLGSIETQSGKRIDRKQKKFTRLTRLNPRNVVWDYSLMPGDVAEQGDYAGYIKQISRTKFKRLLNKWSADRKAYNIEAALASSTTRIDAVSGSPYYKEDPQISSYVNSGNNRRNAAPSWDSWFDGTSTSRRRGPQSPDAMYELFVLYARIMPADFGIAAPAPNTPQIWKFVICNNQVVVYADRIISAFDYLPILFGQPLEDGLGYQTQSIGEGEIPFQKAAATLFNIRFAAARRAVSDRALYVPDMIAPSDVNSSVPAAKIPVKISVLSQKGITDAYKEIPFNLRGTETAIQDASTIVQFSKELHGLNGPRMGQFQKGNKSVKEWDDTMGGSEGRMRIPALVLEHQVFSPLKSILSLNILQYGEDGVVTSQVTGNEMAIKIAELRAANLSFRMADGYTPKSKIASVEVIIAGMTMIGNSPILQQAYGTRLPAMFAHFLSLSGMKGFEQYDPQYQDNQAGIANISVNNPQLPPVAPVSSDVLPPV